MSPKNKEVEEKKTQKMSLKEVIAEQKFMTNLCFSASPKGMAIHIFESVKLQVSIFFEGLWMMNYVLSIAEHGGAGAWSKILWSMVIFMVVLVVSTMTFGYYKHSVMPKMQPVLYKAFRMYIYVRTKDLDLACYDHTEFYQKFILATEESDACVDRYLSSLELYCASITKLLLSLGFCITVNPLILIVTAVSLILELWLASRENRLNVVSRMERLPYEQKREYQNRVFYLSDYAKDLRLYPGMQEKCRRDFSGSQEEIRKIHRKYGKRLFFYAAARDALVGSYLSQGIIWSLLLYQLLARHTLKAGVNLSGGEMQKVAIARTLYRRQHLIIMDEPSSALDPLAEYELNQELNEIAKDKTVIFISHRLSTTRDADCIYMMEQGQIIEAGTHEELIDADGKYARMWKVQAGLYLDETMANSATAVEKGGLYIKQPSETYADVFDDCFMALFFILLF